MLSEFEEKAAGFIKANGLFDSADKILLAVSGGADSVALLYAMWALKAEGVLSAELSCAHINHQLRGPQAESDEDFVIGQAGKLNLAITTRRLDVRGFARKNKLSIETAGRKLRIESLLDIAKANGCDWIATGHHKDDNAETVLQRLIRGTGFRGLGGIWPVQVFADRIRFARPLLSVRRNEIIKYLQKQGLKWQEDKTNEELTYRRNYIRHRLIPELQRQHKGSIAEELFKLSESARRFHLLVCGCADKFWPEPADCGSEKLKLDLKGFSSLPEPVKVELIRRSLATIGSGERDLTEGHFKKILQLAEQKASGKRVELPGGFAVGYEYGQLIFHRKKTEQIAGEKEKGKEIKVPGQTKFGSHSIDATILESEGVDVEKFKTEKNKFVEWFDLAELKLPLVVRLRRVGDRFEPLGLASEKKLGKFLTAAKVPRELRKKLLIIADVQRVIWVWPIRMSEQAKVSATTDKILQLQISDANAAD